MGKADRRSSHFSRAEMEHPTMRSFLPSRKSPRHCWKGQSCHSLNESRRGAAPAELMGYPDLPGVSHPGTRKNCSQEGVRLSATKPTEGCQGKPLAPECWRGPLCWEPSDEADALTTGPGCCCRSPATWWEPEKRTPDVGRQIPSSCIVCPAPSTDRV